MWNPGWFFFLFSMLALGDFLGRRALKLKESLLSAAVGGSERYIILGFTFVVAPLFATPRVPWLQGSVAVLAGVLLGLLMARRYVARAERQLALQQQIGPPFVNRPWRARFKVWSLSWRGLLLTYIVFLAFRLPRAPRVYTEAVLFVGAAVFADAVYARAWLRLHRSSGEVKVAT